jgi:hypothetical protein
MMLKRPLMNVVGNAVRESHTRESLFPISILVLKS